MQNIEVGDVWQRNVDIFSQKQIVSYYLHLPPTPPRLLISISSRCYVCVWTLWCSPHNTLTYHTPTTWDVVSSISPSISHIACFSSLTVSFYFLNFLLHARCCKVHDHCYDDLISKETCTIRPWKKNVYATTYDYTCSCDSISCGMYIFTRLYVEPILA